MGDKNNSNAATAVCVSRCLAWAPDLTTSDDWRLWAAGEKPSAQEGTPAAAKVPPMVRRRLTRWGRLALEVASELAEELQPETPVIFSSRHGDTERTQRLLRDLARAEPLSPTAFSLSVHNASLGLFTIAQHITAPSLALAAGRETLANAWLEAATWLSPATPQVLLVYVDEPLNGIYADYADEVDLPQGIALLLTAGHGQPVNLSFTPAAAVNLGAGTQAEPRSMALEFLAWWYGDQTDFSYSGERLNWTWSRTHA